MSLHVIAHGSASDQPPTTAGPFSPVPVFSVNFLFNDEASALTGKSFVNSWWNEGFILKPQYSFLPPTTEEGVRIYAWDSGTTGSYIKTPPAGMEVLSVNFNTTCGQSGCWVIDTAFTTGYSDVRVPGQPVGYNTFYLPFAEGNDALSYDFDYSAVEPTFLPKNFPCRVSDYDESGRTAGTPPVAATLCCLGGSTGFVSNYRPTEAFAD